MIRLLCLLWVLTSCQSRPDYLKTVESVNLQRTMGVWYVIASRPTFLETEAQDATEIYTYDEKNQKIDVLFRFFDRENPNDMTEISQTAYVFNKTTNAHWKISPWWLPVDMDFLILYRDVDYQWLVVGVPNQDYLWIMSRKSQVSEEGLKNIINIVKQGGYDVSDIRRVQHSS